MNKNGAKPFMPPLTAETNAQRQASELAALVNILAEQLAVAVQACQTQVQVLREADAAVQAGGLVIRARESAFRLSPSTESAP